MPHARSPELRLFISSTFVDLAAEREYLVKHIFPEIRAAARERGVEFTEIDLRWGITTEEAEQGKTITTCLSEVDRCRPYFLGLIGSRYGWQPTTEDIRKDPELLEQFPWVAEAVAAGMSVTEMEMNYGALADGRKQTNALFYSRKQDNPLEERLATLRNRIAASGFPFADDLEDIEALGARVRSDILAIIEKQFPQRAEPSPLEIERRANDTYAQSRRRAYVPNPAYIRRLNDFANGTEDKPLVIVGKSGAGKSSLVAYWSNEFQRSQPDTFLITHYVGAAHSSPAALIRHIMLEIKERGNFSEAIPEQADELERDLPQWLSKLPDEQIVIVLDAVNQLEDPRGHGLNWLSSFIPPNIRLILSTTDEVYGKPDEEHTLAHRRWQEFVVEALRPEERHEITKHYLSQFHKTLTRPQLEALATNENCSSPLFLRTILEELRIFGKYRLLDERIAHYLASTDTDDLFQRVLERMEEDYGVTIVRQVMSLIGASRHGLSEHELLGLLANINRYELSRLLHALDYHLIRNAGLLNFFHVYLRRAVERRYNHGDHECRSSHRQLAEYFHKQPADSRRADEEPYNWQRAQDPKGLQECLSDVPLLLILLEESRRQEIIGYWKMLKEHVSLKVLYKNITEIFVFKEKDVLKLIGFFKPLANALRAASEYEVAEELLRNALALTVDHYGEYSIETADIKSDLGLLLYFESKFEESEKILKEAVEINKEILGDQNISYAETLSNLGTTYYATAKYSEAELAFNEALQIYKVLLPEHSHEVSDTLNNLGTILFIEEKHIESKRHFNESVEILKKIYGNSHIALLPSMTNLSMVEERLGNIALSEYYRKEVIQLSETIYGKMSSEMCLALGNIAVFYSRTDRAEEALKLHRAAQEIRKKIFGEGHQTTILGYVSIGNTLLRLGRFKEGVHLLSAYLPALEESVGKNNKLVKDAMLNWEEFHSESFNSYKINKPRSE